MLDGNFALGFWRLNDSNLSTYDVEKLIHSSLEMGISVMDHADIYGEYKCEEIFGRALKNNLHLREHMKIVSKCGIKFECDFTPHNKVKHYDLSRKSIQSSVHNSLKKLNVEHLDLLLIHRPSPLMNFDEIAESFEQLRQDGLVKSFGVSNFTHSQFQALNTRIKLETNQIECSVLNTNSFDDGTMTQAQEYKFRPMIWSPLAGGAIFKPKTEQEINVFNELDRQSKKYDCKLEQIAYAWLLKLPSNPLPILGTQKINRIEEAIEASKINMDIQDWFKILEVSSGHEVA